MKLTFIATAFLISALGTLGEETTTEKMKRSAAKAGEKTKEVAETVGEKTKDAADAVVRKTKELWKKTTAYLSEDRDTYRQGAREKLDELSKDIAELRSRKS